MCSLELSNGETLQVTPEHRFYSAGEWIAVEDLNVGDTLQTKENVFLVIEHKAIIATFVEVFNLEIEDNENYYVTEDGLLVHNGYISDRKGNTVDRDLLDKPSKRGNAPTFKDDGTSVEIHHRGQNPDGPFDEMHWSEHRGKGNDLINHPEKVKPSKIDRKLFKNQKREYWREVFDNWNK